MTDGFEAERQRFVALVRRWHAGHPRRGNSQIDHCLSVARWLEAALDRDACPPSRRHVLALAALGHDLYEDTALSPADLAADFGPDVDAPIRELTESDGVARYVEQLVSGSEEARLIKFCDGVDNCGSLVENGLARSDPDWASGVVCRHLEPMFERLMAIPFRRYPRAGDWLQRALAHRRARFWETVGR